MPARRPHFVWLLVCIAVAALCREPAAAQQVHLQRHRESIRPGGVWTPGHQHHHAAAAHDSRPTTSAPVRLISSTHDEAPPQLSTHPVLYPNELEDDSLLQQLSPPGQAGPPRKEGMLQKVLLSSTYIDRGSIDSVGMSDIQVYGVLGLPCPTPDRPLLVTPGFKVTFLDGPGAPDLPPEIYDTYVQFRTMGRVGYGWSYDLAITPGVYTDYEALDNAAFRLTGHAIGVYEWSPTMKLLVGAVYLDREDLPALPAVGVIWTPNDWTRYELIAPRPRVAWRWNKSCCAEDWFYVAGEFGGGTYSIQRTGGAQDVITIDDYRLLFGLERKYPLGSGLRIELGYVFGREIEYESATPDIEPDSAFLVRGAIFY